MSVSLTCELYRLIFYLSGRTDPGWDGSGDGTSGPVEGMGTRPTQDLFPQTTALSGGSSTGVDGGAVTLLTLRPYYWYYPLYVDLP